MKILEGKVALYKRGYHVVLRQLKKLSREKKILEKENVRMRRIIDLHEDFVFLF